MSIPTRWEAKLDKAVDDFMDTHKRWVQDLLDQGCTVDEVCDALSEHGDVGSFTRRCVEMIKEGKG